MSKTFDSMEDWYGFVKKDFTNVMANDVPEEIKDKHQEVIERIVYDPVDPNQYIRRYEKGGLLSRDNMQSTVSVNDDYISLELENVTPVSDYTYDSNRGDRLDEIIEYGTDGLHEYSKPRKFIEETQNRVDKEMIVEKILKRKLKYLE